MTRPDHAALSDRITAVYDGFTAQERRAADVLLEHLPDLAAYRASELADLAGVSKATMSRFIRRIGYGTFEDFRAELRRSGGVPARERSASSLADWLAAETEVLRRAYDSLDERALDSAARTIAVARRVVVIGWRTSHPVALHLRQQLAQVRPDVSLSPQPGQSVAEDLTGLGPEDAVVLVATRRRPDGARATAELLRELGVPVLLLADPSAAGIASACAWWVTIPLATHGAFDGYGAAMSLVSLLADRVGSTVGDGWQRARDIDEAYRSLGEVEGS